MGSVSKLNISDIAPSGIFDRVEDVAKKMLKMDQIEAPVIHRFAPGLYIREVHIPGGSFVIGHEHKTEHFNIMLKGHLVMINEDGSVADFIAPQSYVAKPGRKIVYVLEDTVWQNIFPSTETDIDKLEDALLIKGENYSMNSDMDGAVSSLGDNIDRLSYGQFLSVNGITEEDARKTSEREDNVIEMPGPVHPYRLGTSSIEGRGYFLTVKAKSGSILAPVKIDGKRTPAGRFVNHSGDPNAEIRVLDSGDIYLVAIKDIDGCLGGSIGTEVTTDYGRSISLQNITGDKLCQQSIQE